MVLVLLICLLEVCGVFEVDFNLISVFAITLSILLVIPVIMIRIFRIRAPFMKDVLILDMALIIGICYILFTYQMVIMFLIQII